MARPRTTINWEGVSVRFTDQEKKKLAHVSSASGLSMAEFIRQATMGKVAEVNKTGRLEIPVGKAPAGRKG